MAAEAGRLLLGLREGFGPVEDKETADALRKKADASSHELIVARLAEARPGDCVLCSSFTFVASANPIRQLGAEPVFVDSDEASWNLSPAALRRALVQRLRDTARLYGVSTP